MTLMDAQQYDEARGRRRRNLIIVAIVAGLVLAWVAYHLRNYPERRVADKFFAALQQQTFEKAFAIWYQDPAWKHHPEKYSKCGYADLLQDARASRDGVDIKCAACSC